MSAPIQINNQDNYLDNDNKDSVSGVNKPEFEPRMLEFVELEPNHGENQFEIIEEEEEGEGVSSRFRL